MGKIFHPGAPLVILQTHGHEYQDMYQDIPGHKNMLVLVVPGQWTKQTKGTSRTQEPASACCIGTVRD